MKISKTVLTQNRNDLETDLERLVNWFLSFRSCIIAFSGGVDSSLLAFAAKKALGNNAYAVLSKSPAIADAELDFARKIASELEIQLIEVVQNDLQDGEYVKNSVMRCYFCRSNLVGSIRPVVERFSIETCVDGTHADDIVSPRPGIRALREAGFRAPYLELSIGKEQIRQLAKIAGLSNWDRPSEACLSSRIAFGSEIDAEKLKQIELAEEFVRLTTLARIVRVRSIGSDAIVEVDEESVPAAMAQKDLILKKLKSLGFKAVEIDPAGYKSGRMLELYVAREK